MDLFASRVSNQFPSYYSWKPDPNSLGAEALRQKSYHKSLYEFTPFALIHKVLKKVEEKIVPSLTKSNSNLADPKLVPRTFTSFSEKSNHFSTKGRLIKGP